HGGDALDIGTPDEPPAEASFEATPAFDWLSRHAGGHGFTMRYPRGNPHGIVYEPWHWRFRGPAAERRGRPRRRGGPRYRSDRRCRRRGPSPAPCAARRLVLRAVGRDRAGGQVGDAPQVERGVGAVRPPAFAALGQFARARR